MIYDFNRVIHILHTNEEKKRRLLLAEAKKGKFIVA
jgi:hypothetical protein